MRKRIFAVIFILFIMGMVLLNPARYLSSVARGLTLFWATVLPALFPFFFFTKLLSGLGFPAEVARVFEKPVKKLFKAPPVSAFIFFMSVLSGYPIGAKLISEFYKNGVINEKESAKIVTFCSTSAPPFVIGTIGAFMLKNTLYGAIILIAHYLSAIICGLIYCNIKPLKTVTAPRPLTPVLSDNLIGESMENSVLSILTVGGLIAVFSLVIDIFTDVGFFRLFGDLSPFVTGLFEMTRGAAELIKNPPSVPLLLAALTSLVSFGGICIFLQAMTYLSTAKVKPLYYLSVKAAQAVIGGVLAYALGAALSL